MGDYIYRIVGPQTIKGEKLKTGAYYDVSFTDYMKIDAVSSSTLKVMLKAPVMAKLKREGLLPVSKDMTNGRMFHKITLEPDDFDSAYTVLPAGLKKPTISQLNAKKPAPKTIVQIQEWDDWMAANTGKEVVKHDDYQDALGMGNAIKANKTASGLLSNGRAEVTVVFEHEETGLLCKARFDWLNEKLNYIIDYKTTFDCDPWAFGKTSWYQGYDIQAYLYLYAARKVLDIDAEFWFIAQETNLPYFVRSYRATEPMIESGCDRAEEMLRVYKECHGNQNWPMMPDKAEDLDWPTWA